MTNSGEMKLKPGSRVVLREVPPGLLDDLPEDAQLAINEVVGKPIQLNEYDDVGNAELEFIDRNGDFHKIWVEPDFIRAPNDSE